MALTIRLSRTGKKGERKFRIAVKEKRSKRDGKPVEVIGWYEKGKNGKMQVDKNRYQYWISKGAIPSEAVRQIVNK